MPALTKNTAISPSAFKARIKEICEALLPSDYGNYTKDNTSLPEFVRSSYLCNRADLLSDIQYELDQYSSIAESQNLLDDQVFNILRSVFKIMGRCKKIYYYNVGAVTPGTQASPQELANGLGLPGSAGTWTFFNRSFGWNGDDDSHRNVRPGYQSNGNKNVTGYETLPNSNTNWNTNTELSSENTARISTLSENSLIEALNTVEAQFTNFSNTWTDRMNSTSWWDGSATNQNNVSNKIFWVRYWCHSNCHSDHHSRGRR